MAAECLKMQSSAFLTDVKKGSGKIVGKERPVEDAEVRAAVIGTGI